MLNRPSKGQSYREWKETPLEEELQVSQGQDVREAVVNITPDFIKAGKAIFTVANATGEHYIYQVTKKDPEPGSKYESFGPTWFVAMLTGPDNTSDYTYMGLVEHRFNQLQYNSGANWVRLTKASKYKMDSKPIQVFNFAMRVVEGKQQLPAGYSIRHNDLCGRCGRQLTDPTSLATGLGPICRGAEE